jgi:small-conductance mechanosensitive channel
MSDLAEMLFTPYVLAYIAIIIGVQLAYCLYCYLRGGSIRRRRHEVGLPDDVMMGHADSLSTRRAQALFASGLLLLTLFTVPVLIIALAEYFCWPVNSKDKNGLLGVFLALLAWLAFTGTDVAKSTLGGLAFRTLAAFKHPFQVGDRVTIKGVSGKVVGFDSFFVQLDTVNDDRISIPTNTLWTEVLNSANAGDRSSLCVMQFYLSPQVSQIKRQEAEDAIWDAIQSSVFYEPAKPMQIYLSQNAYSIQLTAKAYVASTYNEALFTSDVTQAFLDYSAKHGIQLASPSPMPMSEQLN